MFNTLFVATLEEARKHSQMVNDAFNLAMSEQYNDGVLFDLIKQNEFVADDCNVCWNGIDCPMAINSERLSVIGQFITRNWKGYKMPIQKLTQITVKLKTWQDALFMLQSQYYLGTFRLTNPEVHLQLGAVVKAMEDND